MIDVLIRSSIVDLRRFAHRAKRLQDRFRFIQPPRSAPPPASREEPVSLFLTDRPSKNLFTVIEHKGVVVSTWQSEGICHYAGLDHESFLLVCSLLGLIQWRTLALNPLLRVDDFIHATPSRCLFSSLETKQDSALLLDSPTICPGCTDFYHCLGADGELLALRRTLDSVKAGRPPRDRRN